MRYANNKDYNTIYTVVLTLEEIDIIKNWHMPKYHKAKEALEKLNERYADRIKTDHYYKKEEELSSAYWYHKNSIDIANEMKSVMI